MQEVFLKTLKIKNKKLKRQSRKSIVLIIALIMDFVESHQTTVKQVFPESIDYFTVMTIGPVVALKRMNDMNPIKYHILTSIEGESGETFDSQL